MAKNATAKMREALVPVKIREQVENPLLKVARSDQGVCMCVCIGFIYPQNTRAKQFHQPMRHW